MRLLILTLLAPCFLYAGGVDVGNGTAVVVDFYSMSFESEHALVQHLENTITNIKNNKYTEITDNFLEAECQYLDINKIESQKEYHVVDGKVVLKPLYKGIIKIEMHNCDKPYLLNLEYKN